ncbi:MAG: DUF4097 family beta strand repeat protein [Oscillospiraceae bacterium]|nr:DUF4097 family beta strand repeat protein [Oscillospiraceae bacterium]
MKKGVLTAVIVAVVLIVLGAVMGFAGWLAMGRSFDLDSEALGREYSPRETASEADRIEIYTYNYDVHVVPGDGDSIGIKWDENEEHKLTVRDSGGTLVISEEKDGDKLFGISVFSITDLFPWSAPRLTVSLPRDFEGDITMDVKAGEGTVTGVSLGQLELEGGSGGVSVSGVECSGGAKITCGSGQIDAEQLIAEGEVFVRSGSGGIDALGIVSRTGSVTVENSSGSIDISSVSARDNVSVTNASGGVDLAEIAAGDDFSVRTGSGSLDVENCWAENISLQVASGGVDFWGLNATVSINVRSGSGGVEGELVGSLADYCYVQADTGSGSCNIVGGYGGNSAGPTVNINTGSGSVNVNYEKE